MKRNLKSVAEFAAASPFSEASVRWMLFCAKQNGLAEHKATVKIGRRVYIDPDAFDRWIDSQQSQAVA